MEIKKELIDELLKNYQKPEDVIGENGLLKQLTKALLERAMDAELTHHLGYEKSDPAGYNSGNSRNGTTSKTLKGDFGELEIETPRDRNGSFEPQMVKKHQTRWDGFDDKILSMYARGMTTREIQGRVPWKEPTPAPGASNVVMAPLAARRKPCQARFASRYAPVITPAVLMLKAEVPWPVPVPAPGASNLVTAPLAARTKPRDTASAL